MHARSLLLSGPRQLAWVPETILAPRPDEVLVQTAASAISIGTELPHYLGTSRQSHPPQYPYMTGYESVGKIMQCGANVQHLHIGERVVAFYSKCLSSMICNSTHKGVQ